MHELYKTPGSHSGASDDCWNVTLSRLIDVSAGRSATEKSETIYQSTQHDIPVD